MKKTHDRLTSLPNVFKPVMLILLAMSLITHTLEPILNTPHFTKQIVDEGKEWSELALLSITKLRATFNLKLLKLAQFQGESSLGLFLGLDQTLCLLWTPQMVGVEGLIALTALSTEFKRVAESGDLKGQNNQRMDDLLSLERPDHLETLQNACLAFFCQVN